MGDLLKMISENSVWFWLIACLAFLVIEGLTMGLTTIWFSAGALAAVIVGIFGGGLSLQFAVFFLLSLILLIFTRKIFVQKLHTGAVKTNVDALLGERTVLLTEIPAFQSGRVKVNGQEWTAVAEDRSREYPEGILVEIVRIEGVKLIVRPVE